MANNPKGMSMEQAMRMVKYPQVANMAEGWTRNRSHRGSIRTYCCMGDSFNDTMHKVAIARVMTNDRMQIEMEFLGRRIMPIRGTTKFIGMIQVFWSRTRASSGHEMPDISF